MRGGADSAVNMYLLWTESLGNRQGEVLYPNMLNIFLFLFLFQGYYLQRPIMCTLMANSHLVLQASVDTWIFKKCIVFTHRHWARMMKLAIVSVENNCWLLNSGAVVSNLTLEV